MKSISIYAVYSLCIGFFMVLITLCFTSAIPSIISYLALFWMFPQFANILLSKFEWLEGFMNILPFYICSSVLIFQSIDIKKVCVLLISTVIFILLINFKVNKMNLK